MKIPKIVLKEIIYEEIQKALSENDGSISYDTTSATYPDDYGGADDDFDKFVRGYYGIDKPEGLDEDDIGRYRRDYENEIVQKNWRIVKQLGSREVNSQFDLGRNVYKEAREEK